MEIQQNFLARMGMDQIMSPLQFRALVFIMFFILLLVFIFNKNDVFEKPDLPTQDLVYKVENAFPMDQGGYSH